MEKTWVKETKSRDGGISLTGSDCTILTLVNSQHMPASTPRALVSQPANIQRFFLNLNCKLVSHLA